METTINYAGSALGNTNKAAKSAISQTSTFFEMLEYNRFGIGVLLLAITLIPAGIAGAYAIAMGILPFTLVAFSSMFVLTMVLGLAPMRVLVYGSAINILISLVMIIAGAFF